MQYVAYLALGLIVATAEAFAGSPATYSGGASTPKIEASADFALGCFVAAGGSAPLYNVRCAGHRKISEAEAAVRYLDLSPAAQVAVDVAAEGMGLSRPAPVRHGNGELTLSR
jgi:hypothetical protein